MHTSVEAVFWLKTQLSLGVGDCLGSCDELITVCREEPAVHSVLESCDRAPLYRKPPCERADPLGSGKSHTRRARARAPCLAAS